MRGFKTFFVSSKHKIKGFLIHEKYFQTTNAVDTLPLKKEPKIYIFSKNRNICARIVFKNVGM